MDAYLHIGTGKTGTSSIQSFLSRNRQGLLERGCLYPTVPGNARHVDLGLFIRADDQLQRMPAWRRRDETQPEEFRARLHKQLVAEVEDSSADQVLFSDEALYGMPFDAVGRLRSLMESIVDRVYVVVYLRRQDDHLMGRYQQAVKTGETRTLVEFAKEPRNHAYDYHRRLRKWNDRMRPTGVIVRPFERSAFAGGSLYQDFLSAVDLEHLASELTEPKQTRNESLDAEALEFLRLLNRYQREQEHKDKALTDHRALVQRMNADGPVLTLPPELLDRFMGQWEKSNQAVAREYLGREDGQLFREPRKSRLSTTDQSLDQEELDRLCELAELPQSVRDGLRRISTVT